MVNSEQEYWVVQMQQVLGIFTYLNPICDLIYPSADEPLLNYVEDDGVKVEPIYYVPVIPMVLINGMTYRPGFSTNIPQYNPNDIIENIFHRMETGNFTDIKPWYRNFKGTICKKDNKSYISKGKYKILNATEMEITELPIGKWTERLQTVLRISYAR